MSVGSVLLCPSGGRALDRGADVGEKREPVAGLDLELREGDVDLTALQVGDPSALKSP